jgi:hypothetical protein
LQERGKRYDPLIFPANSPKNSRNGIGCIQRNPKKGIESLTPLYTFTDISNTASVAFNEIPQRELRVLRPQEVRRAIWVVAFNEIPQRELRVIISRNYLIGIQRNFCCIQRNPKKGIESFMYRQG